MLVGVDGAAPPHVVAAVAHRRVAVGFLDDLGCRAAAPLHHPEQERLMQLMAWARAA
jgi:hypothetical protein